MSTIHAFRTESDAQTSAPDLKAAVAARVALELKARVHLDGAEVDKLADLTDRQVREAVVKRLAPHVDLSKASDDYCTGYFDQVLDRVARGPSPALLAARVAAFDSTMRAAPHTEDAAREANINATKNAWRGPVPGAANKE